MKHNHTLLNFALSFFWLSSLSITLARKPFAEDCLEQAEAGKPWSVEQVQEHYIKTIGVFKAKDSVPVKDNAGVESHLSHVTNVVNKKDKDKQWVRTKFTGVMDFTKLKKGTIMLAVHVDDIAELSIESKEANIYRELRCNGGALWNPRSFKKFPYAIQTLPVGYKYEYTITYVNSSNLNNHKEYKPKARQDVDGLNVFVAIIPSVKPELIVPHLAINDADRNQDHIYDHDQPQIPGDIGSLQLLNFSLGGPEKAKATGTLTLEILTPEYARFRGDDDKHSTLPNPIQHTIRYEKGTGKSNYVYLEGLKTTPKDNSLMIKATWEGDNGDLEEVVGNAGVYGVDLDIDSLNVLGNQSDPITKNDDIANNYVDRQEYTTAQKTKAGEFIGKVIFNNRGVNDQNVPAWASGFDASNQNLLDDNVTETSIGTPVTIYLPKPYNIEQTIVSLDFRQSHPDVKEGDIIINSVTNKNGNKLFHYDLSQSGLRLWTKTLTKMRNKDSVMSEGDYVPSSVSVEWKQLVARADDVSSDGRKITLYIEYAWQAPSDTPTRQSISVKVHKSETGKDIPTTRDRLLINLLSPDIVADYNRDGKIDNKDRGKVTVLNPWRWWINDDDDVTEHLRGSNTHDIPHQARADSNDLVVDGMRDLIDFYPLHLDLKKVLEILPSSDYRYVLKHDDEALKFLEYPEAIIDGSIATRSVNVHIKNTSIAYSARAHELKLISKNGVDLSEEYLGLIGGEKGSGVIVVEGCQRTEKALILEIIKKKDNKSVTTLEFPLTIVNVEDMFRRVNLRDLTGGKAVKLTQTFEPSKYPDELTNGKYLAYIHGYNVSEESARGSQSNIFKRLHQLGSNARFIGVFWYGNPPPPVATKDILPPDYHKAVYHGFITGDALKEALSFTKEASLSIMAHSLGNMPTSHAIANRGLVVDNYFMIDAAVPIEAYDAVQTSHSEGNDDMSLRMTENQWKKYYEYGIGAEKGKQQRLFAANWHKLFDPPDNRNRLTWKNIFAKPALLNKAYNFYSTGEEVVENADESETFGGNIANMARIGTSRHAWVSQEIAKGGENIITNAPFHDLNGGWKHNYISYHPFSTKGPRGYYEWLDGPNGRQTRRFTPAEASMISNEALKTKPFYSPFLYRDLYDLAKGNAEAGNDKKRYKILATGLPAMSYAAAANPLDPFIVTELNPMRRNFNMQTEFKNEGGVTWPPLDSKHRMDWGHSDFKNVSFQFVYPMYQKIIKIGSLNKN